MFTLEKQDQKSKLSQFLSKISNSQRNLQQKQLSQPSTVVENISISPQDLSGGGDAALAVHVRNATYDSQNKPGLCVVGLLCVCVKLQKYVCVFLLNLEDFDIIYTNSNVGGGSGGNIGSARQHGRGFSALSGGMSTRTAFYHRQIVEDFNQRRQAMKAHYYLPTGCRYAIWCLLLIWMLFTSFILLFWVTQLESIAAEIHSLQMFTQAGAGNVTAYINSVNATSFKCGTNFMIDSRMDLFETLTYRFVFCILYFVSGNDRKPMHVKCEELTQEAISEVLMNTTTMTPVTILETPLIFSDSISPSYLSADPDKIVWYFLAFTAICMAVFCFVWLPIVYACGSCCLVCRRLGVFSLLGFWVLKY